MYVEKVFRPFIYIYDPGFKMYVEKNSQPDAQERM
jgi:hypothetical protein